MPAKKSAAKKEKKFSQKKLRDLTWEIGHKAPSPPETDHIALLMVHPHGGHVYWHIIMTSLDSLKKRLGKTADHAALVIRIHDVTDVIYNGTNSHSHFDLEAGGLSGRHYFSNSAPGRNLLAETGLRCNDGSFHHISRSGTALFESDRPAGKYSTGGLFSGGALNRTFGVESIFDAPVYEALNTLLYGIKRESPLSVAGIFLDTAPQEGADNPVLSFVQNISGQFLKFGVQAQVISNTPDLNKSGTKGTIIDRVNASSQTLYRRLSAAHKKTPFHIVHCHDWYSAKVGLTASAKLGLPMVLTLYSTEYERAGGNSSDPVSTKVRTIEKNAVAGASLVVVPRTSTRQQVISLYGADQDKVVTVSHIFHEKAPGDPPDSAEIKQWFGLDRNARVVLFAGEISHAAGADIMVDALPTVCRNYTGVYFIFAGDGPLKGELQARTHHAGIGHKCRFPGDISSKDFESLLAASDFVVIPARTWQDEGVARMAISRGKPVLITQQSGIKCVKHGENGLVTFDNPGSIVWGIQELIANPMNGNMLRIIAEKNAGDAVAPDAIAAELYMQYELVLKKQKGQRNG